MIGLRYIGNFYYLIISFIFESLLLVVLSYFQIVLFIIGISFGRPWAWFIILELGHLSLKLGINCFFGCHS